jgi:InsA C-terminal domain
MVTAIRPSKAVKSKPASNATATRRPIVLAGPSSDSPAYKGRSPQIKEQIIEMALNGSGIRDTARVLKISTNTVMNELKKN